MTFQQRLKAFTELGTKLRNITESQLDEWYFKATGFNNWFTRESVKQAIEAIGNMLEPEKLVEWTSRYPQNSASDKVIGVVMAGNIPLVGFHDFLSILMAGHKVQAKLSTQDPYLLKEIAQLLIQIEPAFNHSIALTQDQLKGFDAVIATGSDNSARYFQQYFGQYPHIIRKNRTAVAVLTGHESDAEIQALGNDIFQYYGLGCRNVSKLFVPKGYDFVAFIKNLESFEHLRDHHKWVNNYDYNKSIYLVNGEDHLDSGTFLMKESEQWVSPISVIFYEFYTSEQTLNQQLNEHKELMQCVVGTSKQFIAPGKAQQPELWDYADGIDTMEFLTKQL